MTLPTTTTFDKHITFVLLMTMNITDEFYEIGIVYYLQSFIWNIYTLSMQDCVHVTSWDVTTKQEYNRVTC
jgi:hypothetical protein